MDKNTTYFSITLIKYKTAPENTSSPLMLPDHYTGPLLLQHTAAYLISYNCLWKLKYLPLKERNNVPRKFGQGKVILSINFVPKKEK